MFVAKAGDWTPDASTLGLPVQSFVNDAWVAGRGEPLAPVSPRDGSRLPEVASAVASDVDDAVRGARASFESGVWSRMAPRERGQRLIAFADLVASRADELALTIAVEMGKPVREALETELRAVVNCFRWYGEAVDKLLDEAPSTAPDALALVTREPVGVVAAVVPWNFPLTMLAWKVAPALAAGNSVIVKPAENSTYSALMLGPLAAAAGIPSGVLNILPGRGAETGRALGEHADVDVVAFTGSPAVGRLFMSYSAASNGKRVWPELGGKTASLILNDADVSAAVEASALGCFYNSGQMCTSASRLLVPRHAYDGALETAARVAAACQPGDPLHAETTHGPLVSASHLQNVVGFIERARDAGAAVAAGGLGRSEPVAGGNYLPPVVLGVDGTFEIARKEVFGPVLSVIPYDDLDEAVSVANSTEYGLAAALWGNDLATVHSVSRRLRAGVVWVNCFEEGDMTVPFGGVKGSGFGRDKSLHAFDKFTDLKTTWIQL